MSALPWAQIIGFLLLGAGLFHLWRSRHRAPEPSAYDDSELRAELQALSDRIGQPKQGSSMAEAMDYADTRLATVTDKFGKRLTDLERADEAKATRLEAVEAAAKGARDYAEGTNHSVSTSQAEADERQRVFIGKMETWVGNLRREIRLGFKGTDRGFAAIYDRERLLDMAYDLTTVSDQLTRPSRGEPLGDWTEWQVKAAEWHKAVEAWARLAEKWREGTIERVILATPPSEYKQDWGVEDYNIFPNHNAGHDYKTLCITSRNFHVERKSVDQYMLSAAFVRPSKKPVLSLADLKELEDENPPALPPPEVQDD